MFRHDEEASGKRKLLVHPKGAVPSTGQQRQSSTWKQANLCQHALTTETCDVAECPHTREQHNAAQKIFIARCMVTNGGHPAIPTGPAGNRATGRYNGGSPVAAGYYQGDSPAADVYYNDGGGYNLGGAAGYNGGCNNGGAHGQNGLAAGGSGGVTGVENGCNSAASNRAYALNQFGMGRP